MITTFPQPAIYTCALRANSNAILIRRKKNLQKMKKNHIEYLSALADDLSYTKA